MSEEKKVNQEEFQFVQEKIKQQPVPLRRRIVRKVVLTMVLAVLFGGIASVTAVLLLPWAQETFGKEKVEEISIPKDTDTQQEENDLQGNADSENPSADSQGKSEETKEETVTSRPVLPQTQRPVVITETIEMELEDIDKLSAKIRNLALAAHTSLVTVTAGSSDTDWFNAQYESERSFTGLIVGDNGMEQLILTTYSSVAGADQLKVAFSDGAVHEAALKKYEVVTDLAILSVNQGDLSPETLKEIQAVNWGNSRTVRPGQYVLAVGGPAGLMDSMMIGNLTAVSYDVAAVDGEYQLLMTDMDRTRNSSGVLIDLNGKVIGWLQNSYLHPNNEDVLTAYGISDLKSIIERMCNSQDIVYLGIVGADVTTEIQEKQELPAGVYIAGVEMDSPAMEAGIQSGDIIVDISGQAVANMEQFQTIMLNFSQDQIISVTVMRQGKDEWKEIVCSVTLRVQK